MKARNSQGETVRGFEVFVENKRKPGAAVVYGRGKLMMPMTGHEAINLMAAMTMRGLQVLARTDGYGGEEWLTLAEMQAVIL